MATARTIWTPIFSNLSSSSISLATDTPSLVILAPKDRSIATLRPLGPSVTLTAPASDVDAAQHSLASLERELDLLGGHDVPPRDALLDERRRVDSLHSAA